MYHKILVPLENSPTDATVLRTLSELRAAGFDADAVLAAGNPADEIAKAATEEGCDLIAMATHGHRGLGDVVRGSVASELRHRTFVPVLMIREKKKGA